MNSNEFVEYLTKKCVTHLHMTKKEKMDIKAKRNNHNKMNKNFSDSWFGILPMSFKLIMKKD